MVDVDYLPSFPKRNQNGRQFVYFSDARLICRKPVVVMNKVELLTLSNNQSINHIIWYSVRCLMKNCESNGMYVSQLTMDMFSLSV